MRKILCLVLAFVMVGAFCACAGQDVRGDINTGNNSTVSNASENNSATDDGEFSLGKSDKNSYKNEFLGLSCELPSEWVFYTDEQILELNNIAADYVDEDVAAALENANIIHDMQATNSVDYSSINVNLEKLSLMQMASLDLKKYLESQFDSMEDTFVNMGFTDVNIAYNKIKVDGKEFDATTITAKIQEVDYYSVAFCFKKGLYIANVTVGTIGTDKTADVLNCLKIS